MNWIPVFPSLLPVPMKLLLPRRKGRLLPVQTTSWIFSRNCVKDDSKSLLLPLKKNKTEDSFDRKTKIQPDTAETHSDTEAAENNMLSPVRI